ncbi:response regulator [Pseudomonas arsenicoxydans]|uniref:Response regulator n=1 Tax=Pseudomonas arsenicoxydans TaxID=702115 RepID=A0A502GXK5_9PSED|nr:response regulator [Pseudomonas arsenicoxydans]TPG65693.1 response regulator [Pseudomonas arsenicoxydans]
MFCKADSLRDLNFLLVEDHPFQLIGLQMYLNRLGFYRMTPALDSAEALSMIKEGRRFDVLLCDQHLDGDFGLDLIAKIHQLGGVEHALLISGIDAPAELRQLLREAQQRRLPLRACLSKPLSESVFMDVMAGLGCVR